MKLNPQPQQAPLTNPTLVACLALSDDGTDVVIGQAAEDDRSALSRWALPSLAPLGDITGCPFSESHDTCHTLDRGGSLLAVAGIAGQRLTLIDLESRSRTEPVECEVVWVRMQGDVLAIGGPDTQIRDLHSGDLRWRQDPPAPTEFSYPSRRPLVALHPDGEQFAVGGSGEADVHLHSLAEPGAEASVLEGAPKRLHWLEFSPDGTYLVALDASANSTVVWRSGEWTPHLPDMFGENMSDIRSIAFHPDGEHLAVGMLSGTIKIHRLDDGERLDRKAGQHQGRVQGLAFTPDGSHLVSGGDDGKLLLWTVE